MAYMLHKRNNKKLAKCSDDERRTIENSEAKGIGDIGKETIRKSGIARTKLQEAVK
jgi:hypothetical protein